MSADAAAAAPLRRLRRRSEFLRAARGKRAGRPSFALQAAETGAADAGIGFTVTKKAGNSPERNRIKRRLRAAVTACAGDFAPGRDYVLIGRRELLSAGFADLVRDLKGAIARLDDSRTATKSSRAGTAGRQRNIAK